MTCIVGLEVDHGVWLGADAFSGNDGWRGVCDPGTKIVQLADYLAVGIAGSWAWRHVLLTTPFPGVAQDDERTLFRLADAWRERAQALGVATSEKGATMTPNDGNGTVLIAYRGRLWRVSGDWSVIRASAHGGVACDSIGSGGCYAEGALAATAGLLPAEERVKAALTAAAELCPTVTRPFATLWQART